MSRPQMPAESTSHLLGVTPKDTPCTAALRHPSYMNRVSPQSPLTVQTSSVPIPVPEGMKANSNYSFKSLAALVSIPHGSGHNPWLLFSLCYGMADYPSAKHRQAQEVPLEMKVPYHQAILRDLEPDASVGWLPTPVSSQFWRKPNKRSPDNVRLLSFSLTTTHLAEIYASNLRELSISPDFLEAHLTPRSAPAALRTFNDTLLQFWVRL